MIASEDPKVCFNAAMLSLNQCLLDADVTASHTSSERIAGADLVVICTSYISHSIFYRVRDYCNRYNIKYIYNPDQIINQDRMIESIKQSASRGLGL